MICAKFGWNWPIDSGEEDFSNSSLYFRNFVIISSWKRAGPFICENLKPEGHFVPSFVEIGPVVLEKTIKYEKYNNDDDNASDNDDDDGQIVIRKGHLNLRLRWAKKPKEINK